MKLLQILVVLVFTAVTPMRALADQTNKTGASAGAGGESASTAKTKYGVPPGFQTKGALPPRQAKKQKPVDLPSVVVIPNDSGTNLVITPRPVTRVTVEDDKRVQSPRGSEALPQPAPVTRPAPQPAPQNTSQPVTARQERELEAELLKVIVSRTNPQQRTSALTRIASETGTPLPDLEDQFKGNSSLRGGDLLMGNKIASLAKKSAVEVFASHDKTKAWLATGESFGVAPATLQETAARFVKDGR